MDYNLEINVKNANVCKFCNLKVAQLILFF